MSTNLFLAFSPESSVPLHIVARDLAEATEAYRVWVSVNRPEWSDVPRVIDEVQQHWLDDQPQLDDAVQEARRLADASVLSWIGHAEGWKASLPSEKPTGRLAPIEPIVGAYSVHVDKPLLDGVEVVVFAQNATQALQLYLDWHETFHGKVKHHYTITPFSHWLLVGGQTVLRELMDIGHVGVAGWTPVTGWSIYPADHPLAGE